jgi:protein SCO1/2
MRVRNWLLGTLILFVLLACEPAHEWHGSNISGMMPELQFRLVGPDEEVVDAKSLRGKPVMVFFGFTHCPDVCPTTLTQLKVVLNELGEEADNIQVLLISVDPDRDTPAVMKSYTAGFGPWLLGLTGTEQDLDELRKTYGVYASMESSAEKGEYNVMHSTVVFVFDDDGQARLLFTDVSDSTAVAADIHQLIK